MDPVVLFKIGSLHARSVEQNGIKFRYRGREFFTGTIVAHLDDSAEVPDNLGIVDLASGAIKLRWALIVGVPFLADAFASGSLSQKDAGPTRVALEETGRVLDDGSGFSVKGTGRVGPGSFFSPAKVAAHVNLVQIHPGGTGTTMQRGITSGSAIRCAFVSESCYLDIALPKSLGGGSQRLNLVGGFFLLPLMTLPRTERPKQSRR